MIVGPAYPRSARSRPWLPGVLLLAVAGVAHPAAASPIVAAYERFHASADAAATLEAGILLLNELNCVACHAPPAEWRDVLPGRAPLSLAHVGSRLAPADLREFIQAPQEMKPGTTMPLMRAAQDPATLEALVQYLASLQSTDFISAGASAGDPALGRELYHRVGCVACHAPHPDEGPSQLAGQRGAVPLALAGRYPRAELARFLRDPLPHRPAGRMPAFPLTPAESDHLAAYLSDRYAPSRPSARPVNIPAPDSVALVDAGRRHFRALSCQACHDTGADRPTPIAELPLDRLATTAGGCLDAQPPDGVPHFGLTERQRVSLRTALEAIRGRADPDRSPSAQVERLMSRLNCYACHSRGGKGGVEPPLERYFSTQVDAAHSLGDFGTLPPALDATGRKLTQEWWSRLLWGTGGAVRPYLDARMPAFGQANTAPVLEAWAQADRRDPPMEIDTSGQKLHQRAHYGRILLGTGDGGLGCINCHGVKGEKSLGVPAVDLTATTARLQPEYFKELLLNPQALQPGTLMPPLFAGRPKADQEIEQLWTYLREIDQQRLPDGLLREGEFELRPEAAGHPMVLRTFLDGAGFQAIAVGFPDRLHAAFDAAEVRWALVWRGRFLDAMSTWEERAMTPATPLGEGVKSLSMHQPFARLASPRAPWPETFGPAAGYRYAGMSLDAAGVPTFHYQVEGGLEVADTLVPSRNGQSFQRTLRVRGHGEHWYFRGLAGAAPEPVHFDATSSAVLEEVVTW